MIYFQSIMQIFTGKFKNPINVLVSFRFEPNIKSFKGINYDSILNNDYYRLYCYLTCFKILIQLPTKEISFIRSSRDFIT